MNDDVFARLVAEEVKNRISSDQLDTLMLPENWGRWERALIALTQNLDQQLTDITTQENRAKETYSDSGAEGLRVLAELYDNNEIRRRKIGRFLFHVESRLNEVARRIAVGGSDDDSEGSVADFLRKAIERHQELINGNELIDEVVIDEALWSALDGYWKFPSTSALP